MSVGSPIPKSCASRAWPGGIRTTDPIAKAREAARAVVLRADGAAEFNKHSDALRRWGAYNNAVGEGAVDDSMPPRVQAFPVLVDALLTEVAGAELDEGSRRQLLATWVAHDRID